MNSLKSGFLETLNLRNTSDFIHINAVARQYLKIEEPKRAYVFGSVDGKPVTPASLYKHWIRYAEKNNLRQIRFHDWRHTSATQMIANKIPLKNVQERLGHRDYTTTVNIYAGCRI